MKNILLIILALFLVIIPMITAEQNIKVIEYPLNYIAKADRNLCYTKQLFKEDTEWGINIPFC